MHRIELNQVRAAREGHLEIVMAHETDPEKGGCQFERFFSTTPPDLIRNGLYKALAIACFAGELDRQGSLATIAKLGLGFCDTKTSRRALSFREGSKSPLGLSELSRSRSVTSLQMGGLSNLSVRARNQIRDLTFGRPKQENNAADVGSPKRSVRSRLRITSLRPKYEAQVVTATAMCEATTESSC